jgi:hypothetical protein
MILAVLGETACCRVEVAAIQRFIELFGDAPIGLGNVQGRPPMTAWESADFTAHTNPNAATSGNKRGTESQSSGAGMRGDQPQSGQRMRGRWLPAPRFLNLAIQNSVVRDRIHAHLS